jgi:O-antigen/teichoic acid export membrane protein
MIASLKAWVVELQATHLPAGSIRQRFALGTFWSLTGTIISQGLQLVAAVFAARFLGKAGYGELGIIQSTVGMFGAFAGLALGLTATKNIAEFRKQDPNRAGRILGLTIVVGILSGASIGLMLFAFARPFAAHILNASQLAGQLRLSTLLVFLNTLNGVQIAALSGFEKFADVAKVSAVRGFASFPAIVGGTWLWGLWGAVGGMVVVAAVTWLTSEILLQRECARSGVRVHYTQHRSEWPLLWTFSLPAVLSGVISFPVMWLGNAFLVNRPEGYAEMGIFNAAWQLRNVIIFFPNILNQVLFPILSNVYSSRLQVRRLFLSGLGIVSAVSLGAALPLIVFSPSIMRAFGKGFEGSWLVLILVGLSTVLAASASVVGVVIWSSGRMWTAFLLNGIWALVFVMTATAFLRHGALGLALAYLVSYAVHLIISLAYVLTRALPWRAEGELAPYLAGGSGTV